MKRVTYFFAVIHIFFTSCTIFEKKEIKIPFTYDGNLYLKCKINATFIGEFMFDTGANGLYLDSTFNQKSGLKYSFNQTEVMSFPQNESNKLPLVFECSTITFTPTYPYTMDIKKVFGKHADGIVGWDLFNHKVIKIDYLKSIISVVDSSDFIVDDSYIKIPLTFSRYILVNSEVIFNELGAIKGHFVLDLGYQGSILLTSATTNKINIDSSSDKRIQYISDWGSLNGRAAGFVTKAKFVKFASLELVNPLVFCSKDRSGPLASGEYLGLIGNRILEHFDVTIDFSHKVMYLKPNINYNVSMQFTKSGLELIDRTDVCEGWLVNRVYFETEAEKTGIKPGDTITAINNHDIKEFFYKDIKEVFNKTGDSVSLKVKKGAGHLKINIKLKEYL